mgnify:CR=1 FL=1
MEYSEIEGTRGMNLDETVERLLLIRKQLKKLTEVEYLLTREVIEQMDDIGATESRVTVGKVELSRPVTYDTNVLAGLREITSPEDLAGAYTPPHDVVRHVPGSWNMTKGRSLKKLSHQHSGIIEDAKIYGRPRVKIEENKENGSNN